MTTADMIHNLRLELWNLSYSQWRTQGEQLSSPLFMTFGAVDVDDCGCGTC